MQFISIINYLSTLGHGHPEINSVIVGDYDKILGLETGQIEYPFLWIETPEINYSGDNDNLQKEYQCFITIGINNPPTDSKENYILGKCEQISEQVINKLNEDQQNEIINFIDLSRIKTEPVELNADNVVGWRSEIPIKKGFCAPAVVFSEIAHPSISYDGQSRTISETENNTLDNYQRYFKIWVDGVATTVQTAAHVLDPGFSRAYVELIYSGKNHELICSIDIQNEATDYPSKAYALNPFI